MAQGQMGINGFKMRAVLVQLFSKKYRKRAYLV